ncbi:MAG: hypothetical protein OJF60_003142 [Burkholderiaceae bacterium]|jgi:general secretion pathway protein M|nr:MAG: hypothetical protein OJF60_003142 [Burkholderiaceae bacterium]
MTAGLAAVKARWETLAPRERMLVRGALGLIGVALLWAWLLAPALHTLRGADAEQRQLAQQLEQMKRLQSQAQALKSQPKLARDEALRALQASTAALGSGAQLTLVGGRATVTFKGVSAETLVAWLTQARINARALPTDARLSRDGGATGDARWGGTVVLSLPER